ncbi:hypothetical protein KM043_010366 [Ampulex compressa]|nr:hypothetical protein KM043_010366 [Ampulex compressa]
MDALQDVLTCRLCGTHLVQGKYKPIFEESTDLVQKIKETLPINITPDDIGSQYICLICYDKVVHHYRFIQDVLEHTKNLEETLQIKSTFDLSKDVAEFSKIHSDAVYTCPNCNIDLMILLASNPQGCDYSFQISLAIVGHTEKHYPIQEKNTQTLKNAVHINNNKACNANVKERLKSKIYVNDVDIEESSNQRVPLNQQKTKTFNNVEIEGMVNETYKKTKRKHKEDDSYEEPYSAIKIPKVEGTSYVSDTDLLNHNFRCADTLIKIEPTEDNISWLDSEADFKDEKDIGVAHSDTTTLDRDDIKLDDQESDIVKAYPKIICELCGARYLSQMKYEFHMERHKLGKMHKYVCTKCEKEASSENLLWDHYYHTHKSMQRYICTECGKVFTKRSRLNGHQKNHDHSGIKEILIDTTSDDTDINHEISQKAFGTEMQGKASVNCNLCGKLITDLDPDAINDLVTCVTCEDSTLSLMVDGNEAKVISPRQYHCSKCPKHFVRKERLEFHEMRHNENMKEFVCSTCGKDFSAENSLYEHYLFVHKGARPHICELCGKSFQLKARLKEHHRTHTGERPYQCDVCGQRCMTTNALKLHRKIHFSHNRYTCNICNKSFSKKQNMNEHLEKHWKHDKNVSLPQLFTCPICMEDFPTYRMLKYHMIEVHKIDSQDPLLTKQKPWYECAECNEKFKHQMSLKAHREKVHEGRVNPMFQCDTVVNHFLRIIIDLSIENASMEKVKQNVQNVEQNVMVNKKLEYI